MELIDFELHCKKLKGKRVKYTRDNSIYTFEGELTHDDGIYRASLGNGAYLRIRDQDVLELKEFVFTEIKDPCKCPIFECICNEAKLKNDFNWSSDIYGSRNTLGSSGTLTREALEQAYANMRESAYYQSPYYASVSNGQTLGGTLRYRSAMDQAQFAQQQQAYNSLYSRMYEAERQQQAAMAQARELHAAQQRSELREALQRRFEESSERNANEILNIAQDYLRYMLG